MFDSSNWWIPKQVWFAVDVLAQTIGSNAYFQNSIQVQCAPLMTCTTGIGWRRTSRRST
jgi:hypothetical protein